MSERREFLKKAGTTLAALSIPALFDRSFADSFEKELDKVAHLEPDELASDNDFWTLIQNSYTASANIINLNNGGVSPQPKVVQDAFVRFNELSNEAPSFYMWRTLDRGRETVRKNLAELAGCSHEEIAINRNTTEALETIIYGLDLKKGDEIVLSRFDYPHMIQCWEQRAQRDGIVLKYAELDLPMEDEEEIVKRFTDAMSSKTKYVHVTHVINWTGQILPAKAITKAAHDQGAQVIVDGAHSFAHIAVNLRDIDCDYYGTSLHKWLCAPFGTGMLFVKKERIPKLWTLFASQDPKSGDIRKFESLGTRSFPAEQAIGNALQFHHMVGTERKEARLRYLKNYWYEKVKSIPGVQMHTSMQPQASCAIATFGIQGIDQGDILKHLFTNHRIHTSPINKEGLTGVRVTPHIYTTTKHLDKLVQGIRELAD